MTGHVAETMKRRWVAFEQNEDYLKGASFRFPQMTDAASNGVSEHGLDSAENQRDIEQRGLFDAADQA
jgi:hypothetical protein